MVQVDKTSAYGWPNCCYLTNDVADLIVTTDVGPRIVRFGLVGGPNLLGVNQALHGQTGGDEWRPYGGHRLWHAPESFLTTYAPDNAPATLEQHPGFVRVSGPVEPKSGLQKEMDIRLWPDAARVHITHRLRNHNRWTLEIAPWALTVMDQGGVAVLPLPPRQPHSPTAFLPTGHITLWSYTDLADPRLSLGTRCVLLRQDPARSEFQKIGVPVTRLADGWAACGVHGQLFVKTFDWDHQATYPDLNTPLEVFTNAEILELETLGPLQPVGPGMDVEHLERWYVFGDVPAPQTEADVQARVLPKVASIMNPKEG
jgi:hypothetical protein